MLGINNIVHGDRHGGHIHQSSNLSYVYYLELTDPKYATQFFDADDEFDPTNQKRKKVI